MLCQGQVLAADGTRQAPHLTQHPTLSTAGTFLAGAPPVFTDAESLLWISLRHFLPGPCAVRDRQVPLGFQIRVLRPPSAIRVSD